LKLSDDSTRTRYRRSVRLPMVQISPRFTGARSPRPWVEAYRRAIRRPLSGHCRTLITEGT
jgi:hypothetical protein